MSSARVGRAPSSRHRLLLVLVFVLGLLRGLYWVGTLAVFTPVDEKEHFAYVEQLATGHGIPVVDKDITSTDVAVVAKESPTLPWRSVFVRPIPEDRTWRENYEGMQGPIYYAAMVPAYWVGHALDGVLGAIYAVRVATVLLSLTAIPLTWLLARELFPRHQSVWLMAPTLLVIISGFNGNLAQVTNDAIVVPLGALLAWLVVRAAREPTVRRAALVGLTLGVAVVAKSTLVTLLPALALVLAASAWRARSDRALVVRCAIALPVAALLPVIPWLGWNLANYGAFSPAKEVNAYIGNYQVVLPSGLAGVGRVVHNLRQGFWGVPYGSEGHYRTWWEVVLIDSAIGGLAVAWRRRDRATLQRLAWLAVSIPLGMLAMAAVAFGVFDGKIGTLGRYLYPLLPMIVGLMAAGIVTVVGRRWAAVTLALAVTIGFAFERNVESGYLRVVYETPIFERDAGVVLDQSYRDDQTKAASIQAAVDCPVHTIGLSLSTVPKQIDVVGRAGSATVARLFISQPGVDYYQLDRPVTGPISIPVPNGALVGTSVIERESRASLVGGKGDPLLRVYCPQADPFGARFEQTFPTFHKDASRATLGAWSALSLAGGAVATLLLAAGAFRKGRRTSASPPGSEPPPGSPSMTALVSKSAH